MTEVEATYEDFIASQRTGRRNAIHEIPTVPGAQGTADLSQGLAPLGIDKAGDEGEDGEKSLDSPAKEEEASQDESS